MKRKKEEGFDVAVSAETKTPPSTKRKLAKGKKDKEESPVKKTKLEDDDNAEAEVEKDVKQEE